jgi:hypothetical protein
MAKSFLRANIRFDKIHERNQKPHYSHCTPEEKAFVKAFEAVKQYEMDIWHMDNGTDKYWRKTELGGLLLEGYLKAHNRYMRISNKLGLTEKQECELYNSCHNSRFYGGSF